MVAFTRDGRGSENGSGTVGGTGGRSIDCMAGAASPFLATAGRGGGAATGRLAVLPPLPSLRASLLPYVSADGLSSKVHRFPPPTDSTHLARRRPGHQSLQRHSR